MTDTVLDIFADDFGSVQPITLRKKNGQLSDDTSFAVEADTKIHFKEKDSVVIALEVSSGDFTLDDANKILNWTPTSAQINTLIALIKVGDVIALNGFVKLKKNGAPARSETHKFTIRVHKS